jgi:hypothetical protein
MLRAVLRPAESNDLLGQVNSSVQVIVDYWCIHALNAVPKLFEDGDGVGVPLGVVIT